MQTQVVRAAFHVRGRERHAERVAKRGDVLEVDLFLEILRAGGNQDALAAENRGNQIRERLAGAGSRFREQHAAVFEPARDGGGHFDLARAGLEVGDRARQRAIGREDRVDSSDSVAQVLRPATPGTAGTSGTAFRLPSGSSPAPVRRQVS